MRTICVGIAMSMGALLLSGGAKGKRMALPNAKILIHQVWTPHWTGRTSCGHRDSARETLNLKRRLEEIRRARARISKVSRDTDRDYFMSAQDAKEYGIIDTVISSRDSTKG